jgi:hypothetical protein
MIREVMLRRIPSDLSNEGGLGVGLLGIHQCTLSLMEIDQRTNDFINVLILINHYSYFIYKSMDATTAAVRTRRVI